MWKSALYVVNMYVTLHWCFKKAKIAFNIPYFDYLRRYG